ncbi:hypothetical protein CHS0354_025342 [Potamilus streckersoni]|uniref:Mevalonate kinase n=1 Tax=Potamilus streckersoni TaxID=2493646 RepID=A0AAE0SQB0_9BIVA|nr:hypothetical protein CHS0354_025342 [Potamilus streckersoni]
MDSNWKRIIISAPGKVILHGEHAVVYKEPAIAASLDLRSYLCVEKRNDDKVSVQFPDVKLAASWNIQDLKKLSILKCDPLEPQPLSEELLSSLREFTQQKKDTTDPKDLAILAFLYLYTAIQSKEGELSPLDFKLMSQLPVGAGLGSSASLSVCLSAALLTVHSVIEQPCYTDGDKVIFGQWSALHLETINKLAHQAEKIMHGNPSGIDNSVATYGGAIRFQGGNIQKIDRIPELRILLTNTKVPRSTKALVADVRKKYDKYPEIFRPVMESFRAVTEKALETYRMMSRDSINVTTDLYSVLEDLVDINQNLLKLIGVSNSTLEQICQLTSDYGLHTKLTGAGRGGCAITLLRPDTDPVRVEEVQDKLRSCGFDCWKTGVGGPGVVTHFILTQNEQALLKDLITVL